MAPGQPGEPSGPDVGHAGGPRRGQTLNEFLDRDIAPNTERQYDAALAKVMRRAARTGGVVGTDTVIETIMEEAEAAESITGAKQLIAALKRHRASFPGLDWDDIERARKSCYRSIRTRRTNAPARDTLSAAEVVALVQLAQRSGPGAEHQAAWVFLVQSMLALRFDTIFHVGWEDFTCEQDTFDLVLRAEKVPQEQGAPRVLRGFPWRIGRAAQASERTWQSVLNYLRTCVQSHRTSPLMVPRKTDVVAREEYYRQWRFGDQIVPYRQLMQAEDGVV